MANKREINAMRKNLEKMLEEEHMKNKKQYYLENFFATKKPISLTSARIKKRLDKGIEGHIIVCGLVKGI